MTTQRALWIFLFAALVVMAGCTGCGDGGTDPPPPPGNAILPLNGLLFKGTMGSDSLNKPATFAVTDTNGDRIVGQQIQVTLLSGDGSGYSASITTDAGGVATLTYNFSGEEPFATIRLAVPGVDSVTVLLRADAIWPADALQPTVIGQVAYVSFNDRYSDVRNWLGEPASVDVFPAPNNTIIYLNYENALGVVVMLWDLDGNGVLYDTSSVYGVIVNTVYPGTTTDANQIGIGSTMADLRARFGSPDVLVPGQPDTVTYVYPRYGFNGFAYKDPGGDTILTELHFSEYTEAPVVPDHIAAVNGLYYTGSMGSAIINPTPEFRVEDSDGFAIGNAWIYLSQIEGDGTFAGLYYTDSMLTDASTGIARFLYNFNGSLGHSVMRLTIPEIDTMDVYLRANVLIPGAGGQGQYILFDDQYSMIEQYNGTPASIDTSGLFGPDYVYVNYADQLGVTFALYDADRNRVVYDTSSVYGVIIDTAYTGMTPAGIGIGSSDTEVTNAYGGPDSISAEGDYLRYWYYGLETEFDINDSGSVNIVERILLHE